MAVLEAGPYPLMVSRQRLSLEAAGIGAIIGALVVLPWMSGGYLLLLDWVSGPSQALSPGIFGLSSSALDAIPFRLLSTALRETLGPAVTAWLLIFIFFPIAAAGIANAASRSRWRAHSAALLMICNPFVIDRVLAGHVSILLGLAMLPWLFAAARDAREQNKLFAVRPALWYALAISMNPHAAWLGGAVLLAVAVLPRISWRHFIRTVLVVLSAALVYSYALVLWLSDTRTLDVTQADLEAYQTPPGPGGLLPTVLSLHGYWRADDEQVRDFLGPILGVVLLLLLLVSVTWGLLRLIRIEPTRGAPLVGMTVLGLLLGAGIGGPVGSIYQAAFDYLPLFEAMREQQKWLELVVVGYAIGFGSSVEWLAARLRRDPASKREWGPAPLRVRRRVGVTAAGAYAILPLVIAPHLLWGLGGRIEASSYPQGWWAAEQTMGEGQGQVLFLPWHGYQPFDFTNGRTVATPGQAFFSRDVLSSDAVELPNLRTDSTSRRMAYLDRVLAAGGTGGLARLLAPLGVEYVILAKDREADEYSWVADEPGLAEVLSTESMDVYQVATKGTGRVVAARTLTLTETITVASKQALGTEAILQKEFGLPSPEGARSSASGGLGKVGPTEWQLRAGAPGWVVLPQEWSSGWELEGVSGRQTVAGTVAFESNSQAGRVSFAPWKWLAPAIAFSILCLIGLAVGGVIEHRRQLAAVLGGQPIPASHDPQK